MLFIRVISKFLCAVYSVCLLSGGSSSIEKIVEPVTVMTDLSFDKNSNDNHYFVGNDSDYTDILLKDYSYNELQTYNTNGIINNTGLFEMMENLKISNIVDEEEEEIVYNPYNLREKSNLSMEQIYNLLEGSNLQVLAESYYYMENKYNINAIFLMALNMEESGHGTSDLALYNNNLGGVKSASGGWASFNDWNHSLEYIANLIDEMYLSENGAYYNGTSIYDVNIKYCEGTQWAHNLNTISYELLYKVNV